MSYWGKHHTGTMPSLHACAMPDELAALIHDLKAALGEDGFYDYTSTLPDRVVMNRTKYAAALKVKLQDISDSRAEELCEIVLDLYDRANHAIVEECIPLAELAPCELRALGIEY